MRYTTSQECEEYFVWIKKVIELLSALARLIFNQQKFFDFRKDKISSF